MKLIIYDTSKFKYLGSVNKLNNTTEIEKLKVVNFMKKLSANKEIN